MIEEIIHKLYRLSGYIGKDMLEPISYLIWGLLVGGLFLLLWKWIRSGFLQGRDTHPSNYKWILFLCVVYSTVVLIQAFFSREPGSRTGIDVTLFSTWGMTMTEHAYFVENIMMFIPYGILFPFAFSVMRNGFLCVFSGLLCSVCLELMQLVTKRGYCQVDDILTNTLGAAVGFLCYKVLIQLYVKFSSRKVQGKEGRSKKTTII